MELRFHPEQQRCERRGDAYVFAGGSAHLRLEPVTAESLQMEAIELPMSGRHGETSESRLVVRLKRTASHWRSAVALSWSGSEPGVIDVDVEQRGDQWFFRCGSRIIQLDWTTQRASESVMNDSDGK